MISRLEALIEAMPSDSALISNTHDIAALTGLHYHVGERFIALVIHKKQAPVFILNRLFKAAPGFQTIFFEDHQDPLPLLKNQLIGQVIGVDKSCPAAIVLKLIPDYQLVNISPEIDRIKAIKSSAELIKLKKASHYNDQIMAKVRQSIRLGISEKELADIITELQSEAPQSGNSFNPIVAFNENIADPHAVPSDRRLTKGDVIIVDMGGVLDSYCSDMTRCFFTGPHPELEKIYDIVLEANKRAIAAIRVGIPLKDIDKTARDYITEQGYGPYFTHRLGHGVGKEVHENLDVSGINETLIENGMCFSIEPGIYIPDLGGIRIEDLVCIENDTVTVMNSYPKDKDFITL